MTGTHLNEKLDAKYTSTGVQVLSLLKKLEEAVTDFPADSSCGATWGHYGTLVHTQKELADLLEVFTPAK